MDVFTEYSFNPSSLLHSSTTETLYNRGYTPLQSPKSQPEIQSGQFNSPERNEGNYTRLCCSAACCLCYLPAILVLIYPSREKLFFQTKLKPENSKAKTHCHGPLDGTTSVLSPFQKHPGHSSRSCSSLSHVKIKASYLSSPSGLSKRKPDPTSICGSPTPDFWRWESFTKLIP